jgi:outer membrane protein TolC
MDLRTRLLGMGLCVTLSSASAWAADRALPMPSVLPEGSSLVKSNVAATATAEMPASSAPAAGAAQGPQRFTLEEAKQRALANNKLLALAAMNVESKQFATRALQADYYPKIIGSAMYYRFDEPLGKVLTTSRGALLGVAPVAIPADVINRDASFATVAAAQPVTALLKIRQGVKIDRADEAQAAAQMEKGRRALVVGIEKLFWGWQAAQRIRTGTLAAIQGGEAMAQTGLLDARTALLETKQALQAVDAELADVEEQLDTLLDLPPGTKLDLVEEPLPQAPLASADDAIAHALANSPEIHDAEQDIIKAEAGIRAAKVDYLPNIVIMGGFANQDFASYIQPDFGYFGVQGSYTFFEWGRRRQVVRERETLLAMARQKLEQTRDEVRDKARKAYREYEQSRAVLQNAQAMVPLRQQAAKSAKAPTDLLKTGKDLMVAEVDLVKADMAYRVAYGTLMSIAGNP